MAAEHLIKLLDDPDPEVYMAVYDKIAGFGPSVLEELQEAVKVSMVPLVHERLESLIRDLQFLLLADEFRAWLIQPVASLTEGAWLMTRIQFPDLRQEDFFKIIKPLRDEIWLELSDRLTALEKIQVINYLVFKKNKFRLNEKHPDSPGNNFLTRIMETGQANEHSISLLYALIGQDLGLPLFGVDMPGYPVLSWVDMPHDQPVAYDPLNFEILFYINPADSGTVHSRFDITDYLNRQSIPVDPHFYKPTSNQEFIKLCLEKLGTDYEMAGSKIRTEQIQELLRLWK